MLTARRLLSTGAIPLHPGIERVINETRERRYRLAITTTTAAENVIALLTHALGEESINEFEMIAVGDTVPPKNPAPGICDYALKEMKLPVDECIVFESSVSGIKLLRGTNTNGSFSIYQAVKATQN